ncbi:MAG: DUF1467 family protein [Erythrobacter sp.]
MQWTSVIAIYALVWVMTAFVSLPFGVRTSDELGEKKVPGQADSAPANFQPGRVALRTTWIAALLTTVYVLNYEYGWIGIEDIDFLPDLPSEVEANA